MERTDDEKKKSYEAYTAFMDELRAEIEDFVSIGGFTEQQARFLVMWARESFYRRERIERALSEANGTEMRIIETGV